MIFWKRVSAIAVCLCLFVIGSQAASMRVKRQSSFCKRACTREIRPVRAFQGTKEFIFPNSCTFETARCDAAIQRAVPLVKASDQSNIVYPDGPSPLLATNFFNTDGRSSFVGSDSSAINLPDQEEFRQ